MIDAPYIIVLVALLALTILNAKDRKNVNYFIIASVIAFVFTAFRAPVVGADTYNYVRFFTGESLYYTSDNREFEPLFTLYNSVMKVLLFKSGFLYMVMNSFLSLLPLYILVKHNAFNKPLAVFFFFLTTCGMMYFVVLRQILSMAIMLAGVIYVQKNRPYKLPVLIAAGVIAYFMHASAIYVLPVYLACYFIPIRKRWVPLAIIAFSILGGFFFLKLDVGKLLSVFASVSLGLADRLENYFSGMQVDTSGFSLLGLLRRSMVGLFVFSLMPEEKVNHWFSKIYLVGIVMSNFFSDLYLIDRIILPFEIFSIICVTWAFGPRLHKASPRMKLVSYAAAALIGSYLIFGYMRDMVQSQPTDPMRMHPYYFVFQDYQDHPSIIYNFD